MPGSVPLPGTPTKKIASQHVEIFQKLRCSYEAETGYCAASGRRLTDDQRENRKSGFGKMRNAYRNEALLLIGRNGVDSRPRRLAEKNIDVVSQIVQARESSRVIRKKPSQLCR